MQNISETIRYAAEVLRANGIPEPRREANSLLALALSKARAFLIAHPEYELTKEEDACFQGFLERRSAREPFQHIVGKQEFYGLDFAVTSDVLIPRPETEMVVEIAIGVLGNMEHPNFCEIGIGSGCIGVAILKHLESAIGTGLDISEAALHIARRNAQTHGVLERLKLLTSDVFEILQNDQMSHPEIKRFDLIVSNPPYIPLKDFQTLQPEVREFDPKDALTDGQDGLSIIRRIIEESPGFLKPGGFLLLEIGINQADQVRKMFSDEIWCIVETHPDLQGILRVVSARTLR